MASLPQFPYLTHKGSNSTHLMESPCCEDYLRLCVCLWPRQVCSVTINCCSCYYWCYFTLGCIPRGNFKAESGLFTGGSNLAREAQSTTSLMSSRLHRGDLYLPSNSLTMWFLFLPQYYIPIAYSLACLGLKTIGCYNSINDIHC